MNVSTKTIDDVLLEYSTTEMDLELKIKNVLDKMKSNFNQSSEDERKSLNFEKQQEENSAIVRRNERFIKDLELTKAKLRSQYCYRPATQHFEKLLNDFKFSKK